MKQFWRNLKRTQFWRDRSFQVQLILIAVVITLITKSIPLLAEPIRLLLVGSSCIGLPVTILAIYDGLLNEDEDDP